MKKQTTDWFRVECWDTLAIPASRLKKADAVFVQGELRTSEYVKDGVTIPAVSIVAATCERSISPSSRRQTSPSLQQTAPTHPNSRPPRNPSHCRFQLLRFFLTLGASSALQRPASN
jgi:single-stranded DNA-binding protein